MARSGEYARLHGTRRETSSTATSVTRSCIASTSSSSIVRFIRVDSDRTDDHHHHDHDDHHHRPGYVASCGRTRPSTTVSIDGRRVTVAPT